MTIGDVSSLGKNFQNFFVKEIFSQRIEFGKNFDEIDLQSRSNFEYFLRFIVRILKLINPYNVFVRPLNQKFMRSKKFFAPQSRKP